MRIVGIYGSGTQSRTFESFPKIKGMVVYGAAPEKSFGHPSNILNFKNTFKPLPPKWSKVMAKQLNKSGPIDVLITAFGGDLPRQINAKYKVMLTHGEIGKRVIEVVKPGQAAYWKGLDLVCGGMDTTRKYLQDDLGLKIVDFLPNALPQYDLVHRDYNSIANRKRLFRYLGKKYKETIMFVGFCCRTDSWFIDNNEDYFKALRVIIDYAKANPNSLIMTKTRKPVHAMEDFLRRHQKEWGGWTKRYFNLLGEAKKQPNIHWMDGKIPVYSYFFCNKIVINASSTLEVEGLLASKPVIVFKSKYCPLEDGLNTVKEGAAKFVRTQADLKHALYNYNQINLKARARWMKKQKITFDGLHSQRIINKLIKSKIV